MTDISRTNNPIETSCSQIWSDRTQVSRVFHVPKNYFEIYLLIRKSVRLVLIICVFFYSQCAVVIKKVFHSSCFRIQFTSAYSCKSHWFQRLNRTRHCFCLHSLHIELPRWRKCVCVSMSLSYASISRTHNFTVRFHWRHRNLYRNSCRFGVSSYIVHDWNATTAGHHIAYAWTWNIYLSLRHTHTGSD